MEKLIYLLGDTEPGSLPRARTDLREALLESGPALARAGAQQASFTVADLDDSDADRVPQFNRSGLIDATLSLWLESVDHRQQIESTLSPLAMRLAGYLVTESVPRALQGPDPRPGERGPGVSLVTTFPKPERIDDETFYARWHGSHTPLSLEIHPLLQYIRNSVARVLTPGAPRLHAIVNESVASAGIAADPVAFYRTKDDRKRAVEDLLSFIDLETLSTVVMSEYALAD
ncbi:MAG: hypothetical protein VX466_11590 [Myxococcota bacterium]|nr:hypothetical protein [Myxococcota bacterium]